ncbi:MAG TPA: hypothetical protein VJZ71_10015 [Phycisphaerae bacterium]|nr:hypothetical protein [Phycisphaerae bacterium]
MRTWPRRLGFSVWTLAALAGCSEMGGSDIGGERTEGWSQAALPNVPRDEAFDAGVHALRQWFRLEDISPQDGVVRSAVTEYDQKGGTGRIRDTAIGYRNRMRHQATLLVATQGTGSVAKCMVSVERLDTADHRVFRDQERFQDYPSETPIDRDAGISASQDQVWTPMPRDRKLEQDILEVLRNRAAPPPQTAPAQG